MSEAQSDYLPHIYQYNAELRSKIPPFFIASESSIPSAYIQAAQEEIRHVASLKYPDTKIADVGDRSWMSGRYSIGKYIEETKKRQGVAGNEGYGPQLNLDLIFQIFENEELLDDGHLPAHFRVMIFSQDLHGYDTYWGFGRTDKNIGLEVISISRFLKEDPKVGMEMWRRLVRHETGHLFGLVNRTKNTTQLLGTHCTNVCCMRQGEKVQEWKALTMEENSKGITFCNDCTDELQGVKKP